MKMFKGEPDWSTKQLLDEIKAESVRGGNSGNLAFLMPAFAALLVKLSSAANVGVGFSYGRYSAMSS